MTARARGRLTRARWAWWITFGLVALYVAARMGAFALSASLPGPEGAVTLPNTFASVDHPFHVARAVIFWRELGAGHLLRWVGQHQGGYPVEFYPLGEAWLEAGIRAASLGALTAEGAHTLAVVLLFFAPGAAFAALAREDGWTPAVGLLAFALHIALPGGWYHGGYTELVQWGLVTNVAGTVAAFAMLPLLLHFLPGGSRWAGALAAILAAWAVYANPRSLVALVALGLGAGLAVARHSEAPNWNVARRLLLVAITAALLAAPELVSLARFDDLYAFVHYSGYESVAAYLGESARAIGWPVFALAVLGMGFGLMTRTRLATRSAASAVIVYVALTLVVSFVPAAARLTSQLEATRLMPLQRLLTLYLAAAATGATATWLGSRLPRGGGWLPPVALAAVALAILVAGTRPLAEPPDPASPTIPPVSLYAVTKSADPVQEDLATAVRLADAEARPGSALLILGSALSWHQPLWAPLWTNRPLYFDNWLWSWHADHAGTPGYDFAAGNHYPDPEHTLDRDYLDRHGIGAVVVTGPVQPAARSSPLLRPMRQGVYDVYTVADPVTMVTIGDRNVTTAVVDNQHVSATGAIAGQVVIRANWHPRWSATIDEQSVDLTRRNDGYLETAGGVDGRQFTLVYAVQPLDWLARALAAAGVCGLGWIVWGSPGAGRPGRRWYSQREQLGSLPIGEKAGPHPELDATASRGVG